MLGCGHTHKETDVMHFAEKCRQKNCPTVFPAIMFRTDRLKPFHPHVHNSTFSQPFKKKCISDVLRIGSIIIFHLSKLWKAESLYCVMLHFWWGCREIWHRSSGEGRVKRSLRGDWVSISSLAPVPRQFELARQTRLGEPIYSDS